MPYICTGTPQTDGSQPPPMRAKSGKRIPPHVIEQIQQYDQSFTNPQIQEQLVSKGFCTCENAPSVSTISRYRKQKSQQEEQRSTGIQLR